MTAASKLADFYINDPLHSFTFDSSAALEGSSALPQSSLSMVWQQWDSHSAGLLRAWQKPDGSVWLRNGTANGMILYQIPISAANGTSLALTMLQSTEEDGQLRLFYASPPGGQGTQGGIYVAEWYPNSTPQNGWKVCSYSTPLAELLSTNPPSTATTPVNSAITQYDAPLSVAAQGNPNATVAVFVSMPDGSFQQVVKSSDAATWNVFNQDWARGQLTNSTPLAATDDGKLYAVAAGVTGGIQELVSNSTSGGTWIVDQNVTQSI